MSGSDCFAQKTREIIKRRGYKQKTVAARIGVSENQFSAMLTGRKIITVDHVLAIANALGATPNELFGISSE